MSRMTTKRKTKAMRDGYEQGTLPFLWPDQNGSLSLTRSPRARSSGLQLLQSPRSPRAEVVRASRLLQSQSFVSWFLSKNSGVFGFGMVRVSLFETWLSARLESCAFNALSLSSVVSESVGELHLDLDEIKRLLIKATRQGGVFQSDGEIITFR